MTLPSNSDRSGARRRLPSRRSAMPPASCRKPDAPFAPERCR